MLRDAAVADASAAVEARPSSLRRRAARDVLAEEELPLSGESASTPGEERIGEAETAEPPPSGTTESKQGLGEEEEDDGICSVACCCVPWPRLWRPRRRLRRRGDKQSTAPDEELETLTGGRRIARRRSSSNRQRLAEAEAADRLKCLESEAWKRGLELIERSETQGLGARAAEPAFREAIRLWRNRAGETILHVLARNDKSELAACLLEHVDAETRHRLLNTFPEPERGLLPLHMAAYAGNSRSVRTLLSHGAQVFNIDSYGLTALHRAASAAADSSDCAQALLEAGANMFERDRAGYSAWHKACFHGKAGVLRVLLAHARERALLDEMRAADLSGVDGKRSMHLVATFVLRDTREVLQVLLGEAGDLFSVDDRGPRGRTPLHAAAAIGNEEGVTALLDMGAGINSSDADLKTPLQLAVEANHLGVCRAILSRGDVRLLEESKQLGLSLNRFDIVELFDDVALARRRRESTPPETPHAAPRASHLFKLDTIFSRSSTST